MHAILVLPSAGLTGEGATPAWIVPVLVAAVLLLLTGLESRRPLRSPVRAKPRRVARNLATGALAAAVVVPLQLAVTGPAAVALERAGFGLLRLASPPAWLHVALAVLLLDWTLWLWHRWNHVVPFLWRFHLVHHVDQDLDASTALRFHFGEMALSMPYRLAQIALIGAPAAAVSLWTAVLFVSILFHHSNVRLPLALERRLVRLVVTPRMHGIHHSTVRAERNSNYASLLTIWDRLHGTLLLSVPQSEIRIGVPSLLEPEQATFGRINLSLPFGPDARAGLREEPGTPSTIAPPEQLAP